MEKTVTAKADRGTGSLRQAIIDINNGSDSSNTIDLRIPNNAPIVLESDLPVIKKNTVINSIRKQPIDGKRQYRLFATIMADLTVNNCTLQNGAAIGGDGSAGGMGAGGGVYIDRGNTLTLSSTAVLSCVAKGGKGLKTNTIGGGGASFSNADKQGTQNRGGGDYPGTSRSNGKGGAYDGSPYLHGYGGGTSGEKKPPGGGDGAASGNNAGYCGGSTVSSGGAGGNGGANARLGGGGGFGSGGGFYNGAGGFGGGGNNLSGGGFGGGGGSLGARGGNYGGDEGGGGAGLGGAIFVGDTAICIIQDNVSMSENDAIGGEGKKAGQPYVGQGYAPNIFLFRKAKVVFKNQESLNASYSIMADLEAPAGHLDNGIIKQGSGQLTLSNIYNNFRGGTSIEQGTLSISDPKVIGAPTSPITLAGGTLQVTKTLTLSNPIAVKEKGTVDVPKGVVLNTTGDISGNGKIRKTGDGIWNRSGSCANTVKIYVSDKEIVTTNADSGDGSLRQAIIDINSRSDTNNTIELQIPKNTPISIASDLPVIRKNTVIHSKSEQIIDGNGKYRLFATIMADLSLTNCTLQNGAAIGGNGGYSAGGGMGAGGGVYIDRGNTLIFSNAKINNCKAIGGKGKQMGMGGGGASFSTKSKNATPTSGGGDYPGFSRDFGSKGGEFDGSSYIIGYGGGDDGVSGEKGGGNGSARQGNAGYCGGGGNWASGGNGGKNGSDTSGGGGGFGSGGGYLNSGGGFGGGGVHSGGGGFGGGGGGYESKPGKGGRFGGGGIKGSGAGGGAGIGGAIFVGDTAVCIIRDQVSITGNIVEGGSKVSPGQGYAPDIFLFREGTVIFENQEPLSASYSIMADLEAPSGHLDKGIIKQGFGQLTLSNTDNNYRGGTRIEAGILSITNPKVIGAPTSPITLAGGTLQVTKTLTLSNPIAVKEKGTVNVPKGVVLNTTGDISGNGKIRKTGDGIWNRSGSCANTVKIAEGNIKKIVTTYADSGSGSLRQAILDINSHGSVNNTIQLEIPNNTPISIASDLPVIRENTVIQSTGQQIINGNGKYRLFATIMADLTVNNCSLRNGAAIGGNGNAGGLGAGGGIYIDRGNTLILTNTIINSCIAQGGEGSSNFRLGGGGASFSTSNKNAVDRTGGGDYPGMRGKGGASDGSPFLTGYGGGDPGGMAGGKGGGNGVGKDSTMGSDGGYCGGAGGDGGGGGNGGGNCDQTKGGGGGFGSGGADGGGGGGFGGGGAIIAGGGFGGGGGAIGGRNNPGKGGRFGGDGTDSSRSDSTGGGGAGLGGAIFVGDTATCIIQDSVSISDNQVTGGSASNRGQGYASEIFLFRKTKVVFNNQESLIASYSIMADLEAPAGHLDNGIIKQGSGQLVLSNTDNNYRGGTRIEAGILSITNPKVIGAPTSPITLAGGTLQVTKTLTLSNPIAVKEKGTVNVPKGVVLNTTGDISGNGKIRKTGDGIWNRSGSCANTVKIYVSDKEIVTTNADSGDGSLRQAIIDINSRSDTNNTIELQIPKNTPISIASDLPVIRKNTVIHSKSEQIIDGNGKYRLFATIMADLTLTNCTLQNGAAIGGSGGGGGMGAGGGVYIDRGNTLTLINTAIKKCKAQGGAGGNFSGGGGASFSTAIKNSSSRNGAGDYPGLENGSGGAGDGSTFLTGYGGGGDTTNNGRGADGPISTGGYCGGQGSTNEKSNGKGAGGGGNGGGNGIGNGGGGGFGSGGGTSSAFGGGGGFGGGGSHIGAGGFGGGGGTNGSGGLYGGAGTNNGKGGGAGVGGAIFIGDSATVIIEEEVIVDGNSAVGGIGANPGEGYAQDIFLFRIGTLSFNNSIPLHASFAIQADLLAPMGHLDNGIVKRGAGQLFLTNPANNYRGGTVLQEGTLSIADPKVIGSPASPITLEGGTLEVTKTLSLQNPIVIKENSIVNVPEGVVLTTTGNISGSGVIRKTGDGLWNQYGKCSNTVGIHIDQGILHAHKTLPLKNVKVRHKTIFQGSAITSGDFINEGLVRLGSLMIHRNYIQTHKGSLYLQVRPNGIHESLVIRGIASIDGALHLDFATNGYDFPDSYTLITASSLIGFFTQITSNKPGIGIINFETNEVTFTRVAPEVILPNQISLGSLLPEISESPRLIQDQTIYYVTNFPKP